MPRSRPSLFSHLFVVVNERILHTQRLKLDRCVKMAIQQWVEGSSAAAVLGLTNPMVSSFQARSDLWTITSAR